MDELKNMSIGERLERLERLYEQSVTAQSANTQQVSKVRIANPENEDKFTVDGRKVTVPSCLKCIGVLGDCCAEKVEFEIPRYFDGVDLQEHVGHIDFINAGGEVDTYLITEINSTLDTMNFVWDITNKVTKYKGTVKFALRFETCSNEKVIYSWRSEIAEFDVQDGIQVSGEIAEQYPDALQQWESKIGNLDNLSTNDKSSLVNAINEVFEAANNVGRDGVDGKDGQDGTDGKSAYELAVQEGYTGTLEEWLLSLQGSDGIDGQDGQNGSNGQNGSDGVTPHIGDNGNWYIGSTDTGVKARGEDGQDGQNGQNGSDATVTVDSALSDSSTNPVQNKVVKGALDELSSEIVNQQSYAKKKEIAINPLIPDGWCETKVTGEIVSGSANLLDGVAITSNMIINDSGVETASSNYFVSDYIQISASGNLAFSGGASLGGTYGGIGYIAFYDSNKNFVIRTGHGNDSVRTLNIATANIPTTTGYMRVCIGKNATSETKIIVAASTSDEAMELLNNPTAEVTRGGLQFSYSQRTDLTTLYELLENLTETSNGYITRQVLGKDESGTYDVKCYTLNSTTDYSKIDGVKPTVIITGGIHGTEQAGSLSLYCLIQDLSKNYKQSKYLSYLRNYVKFIIVPVVNPWGFTRSSYKNSNGVNLNRNFSVGHDGTIESSNTWYGGATPFSEVETQYIQNIIDNNTNAFCFIDVHSNSDAYAYSNWAKTMYTSLCNDYLYNESEFAGLRMIDETSQRIWGSDWTTADFERAGDVVRTNSMGIGKSYACDNGVMGMTLEVTNRLMTDSTEWLEHVQRLNAEIVENFILELLRSSAN